MPVLSGLTKALQSRACVSSLKVLCFEAKANYVLTADMAAIQALQVWIIERAPHIEALRLLDAQSRLIACAMRLQHLKHVEMQAHAFVQGVVDPARQILPCLETLFLHDEGRVHGGVDVLGFHRLRHLVVEGRYVQRVPHDTSCHLGLHVHHVDVLKLLGTPEESAALRRTVEATIDLVLTAPSGYDERTRGPPMFEHFASLENLRVNWPLHQHASILGAKDILSRCMPLNGRPLGSLKSLIIVAEGALECLIPKALPNLEELVLFSTEEARVYFDDAHFTLTRVETFYVLGQTLILELFGSTSHELQVSMARKGLTLSTAIKE